RAYRASPASAACSRRPSPPWREDGHEDSSADMIAVLRRLVPQRSLPPCGGGTGRGVSACTVFSKWIRSDRTFSTRGTPLPTPPPQGGREQTAVAATDSPNRKSGRSKPRQISFIRIFFITLALVATVAPARADN